MKVLLIAGNGFLGANIKIELEKMHDVYVTSRKTIEDGHSFYMDLEVASSIKRVLNITKPDVIISCAGIISANEDTDLNIVFTRNLLTEVALMKKTPKRIIISGSAAEYGNITKNQLPVGESNPLRALQGYGLSKLNEEIVAHELAEQYNLPVIVVRIFNPIGKGMRSKFLIPSLQKQISEYIEGKREYVELSRLDSSRDYISVHDIATAISAIIEGEPNYTVYNIGSGVSTSNNQLLNMIISSMNLSKKPQIRQTSDIVEPLVAIQADIGRLANDFGWMPLVKLEDTIKEITDESR